MRPPLSIRAIALRACLAVASVMLSVVTPTASAAPIRTSPEHDPAGHPYVTLDKRQASVPIDGTLELGVTVMIDRPTSYLESRVQIRRPNGGLLYQKTEVRNKVATGTVEIDYERQLADLDLKPGEYPIELRVRSDAGEVREWTIEDTLLVYDPKGPEAPVSVVVRIGGTPSLDTEGRFVIDPAQYVVARDRARELAQMVIQQPTLRVTLAIPAFLPEEWARAAQGYEIAGPTGVETVPASEAVPKAYGETLELLRTALHTGRLELIDQGYSLPDVAGLSTVGLTSDLFTQYERGMSGIVASLETSPSPGTVTYGGVLTPQLLDPLARRSMRYALVEPRGLTSDDATATSGVYSIAGSPDSTMTVCVLDPVLSDQISQGDSASALTQVFKRVVSNEPTTPLFAIIDLGPGHDTSAAQVAACCSALQSVPWARLELAGEVAGRVSGAVTLPTSMGDTGRSPNGYWEDVAEARRLTRAFEAAAGSNDPSVRAAIDASLMSESALWAGLDGSWSLADRGRAFAAFAQRTSSAVLDAVSASAQDVTLSSARGEIPISIRNDSEKTLHLTVRVYSGDSGTVAFEPLDVSVGPQENFITIPVDLESSLATTLKIDVLAADVVLDETTVTVRASYLDRLVIVAGVALVLVGMLLFIRHRIRTADSAGTMKRRSHGDTTEE